MYEENLSQAEKELESVLGQIKPTENTLNRDVLMFNAGRATTGNKRPWQLVSGMLTVVLFCSFLYRPNLERTQLLPYNPNAGEFQIMQTSHQPVEAETPDSLVYPILRQNVIRYGLDALRFQKEMGRSKPHKNRKELLESMFSS